MNSLVDRDVVKLLYQASQAGVRVDLIVRGMCILRPGVPGFSDNITVTSIVGRFLEHTRIYFFENDGEPTVLIGSADLMRRNLDRRVEVLAPVNDPALISRLRDEILQCYLDDNVKARRMDSEGTYTRIRAEEGEARIDAQARAHGGLGEARGPRAGALTRPTDSRESCGEGVSTGEVVAAVDAGRAFARRLPARSGCPLTSLPDWCSPRRWFPSAWPTPSSRGCLRSTASTRA